MSTRGAWFAVCFFLGSTLALGQSIDAFWMTSGVTLDSRQAMERVDRFVSEHRGPNDSRHLARVFRKFHHSFLKTYVAHADFASLFTQGKYDCLTATSLLSEILGQLGYRAEVIETTYHIFIKVRLAEGEVLLETTDRVGGFIAEQGLIAARMEKYRTDGATSSTAASSVSYRYRCEVFRTVTASDLTGLLLYNQAVKAYNGQQWGAAAKFLEASFAQYPTPRCHELAAILLRTLRERTDLDLDTRRTMMEHLAPVIVRRSETVAAN